MKERLSRFFAGRNGNDQLNIFLMWAGVVFLLISAIFKNSIGRFTYPVVIAILVIAYYRMLSKDIYRRQQENGKYMRLRYKYLSHLRVLKEQWSQRREYKFFTCPSCRTTLRVPRGRGKIRIVCRKCGVSFTGRS